MSDEGEQDPDSNLSAISTRYDGYKFRSRLEARWAVFFNTLNIDYQYEKEGYELPSGELYLPDFYLPDIGLRSTEKSNLWVEIKGEYSKDEWDTFSEFLKAKNENGAFLTGDVTNDWNVEANYEAPRWDNFMIFVKCTDCGRIKYEFSEGNYMSCESCGGKCEYDNPDIETAVENARSARFEHGESPSTN